MDLKGGFPPSGDIRNVRVSQTLDNGGAKVRFLDPSQGEHPIHCSRWGNCRSQWSMLSYAMPLEPNDPRIAAVTITRLWRPMGVLEPVVLALYRVWLVSLLPGIASLVVVLTAIGADIARRPFINGKALLLLVVLAMVPLLIRHSTQFASAAWLGFFTRRGVPVRRTEQPRRYWCWVAAMASTLAIEMAAAAFLISAALIFA